MVLEEQPKMIAEIEPTNLGTFIQLCHSISCGVAIICKAPQSRSSAEANYVSELEKVADQFDDYVSHNPNAHPVFGLDSLPLLVLLASRNRMLHPPAQQPVALTKLLSSLCQSLGVRMQGLDEAGKGAVKEYMDAYAHMLSLLGTVGEIIGNPDLAFSFLSSVSTVVSSRPSRNTAQSITTQATSL
eukprot:c12837_g1_i2.p1 GENE.c12837_g1_i2~~c12837_g1_i2.p1  ORF type:complete len:186 (-),score=56.74 c12837_g1_i2:79-636(-)